MKHRIEIDGEQRDIEIRAMDESFVVYRKMYVPPITRENLATGAPEDPPCLAEFLRSDARCVIEAFLRKEIQAMGSCAVLAWDGDGVIGKMYFTTKELFAAIGEAAESLKLQHDEFPGCMCIEGEDMPKVVQSIPDDELESLLASGSRTIRVLCFNVGHFDGRYHSKGIASAMLEFLKAWAKENGWARLEAASCADVVPFWSLGPHVLRRGSWERRGFQVVVEKQTDPRWADIRRKGIERALSSSFRDEDWDVKAYPDNIARVKELAEKSYWESVFDRDYLMACDL